MKRIILFILCLLTGLMFINAGLNKFFNYIPVPKDMPDKVVKVMGAFMQIAWLMPLVGAMEVLSGLLFIIPRTRPLGAIMLVPLLAGILLHNIYYAPSGLPIVGVLIAIVLWLIIENRSKYLPMVSK